MDTKALRQKILDLAIRGELVPQDPNDEPASALLERIREQKQQMVKEGKLKKKDIKNDSVIFVGEDNLHYEKFADGSVKCIEDEIPFELPDGWNWARLGSIANIVTGRLDANAQTKDGAYPFFTCGEEVFKTDSYAFDCNAILLGGNNATGDFKMHKFSGKFNAYQRVYVITTFPEIDVDYLYNHIRYYLPRLQSQSIGSQTRYLKLGMITELLIALPTFCEQKTISRACDKYINYCTEIASEKNELKSIIKDTKSKILDLAIRGQLVPQNPDDEPASVLLGRIRAEKEELIKQGKSKRDKKESIIFKGDDNSYYDDIPDGWEICYLGELFNVCSAKRVKQSDWRTEGVPFYRAREIVKLSNNDFVDNELYISEDHYQQVKKEYGIPQPGDLMVSGVGTIGKVYVVKDTDHFYYKDASVLCFENRHGIIDSQYAKYMLMSEFIQNQMRENSKGTTVDTITISAAMNYICFVPPANEQKRIVSAIEQILNHLKIIELALL